MRHISHSVDIPLPPATVWEVLTDTASYPRWNPFVTRLTGELVEGGRVEVAIRAGERTTTFRPRVEVVARGSLLRWKGRLLVPGSSTAGTSSTWCPPSRAPRLVHSEFFAGVLVPFLGGMLRDTGVGFRDMNLALLAECMRRQAPVEPTAA